MIFKKLAIAALVFFSINPALAIVGVGQKTPALIITDLQGHKFDLQALRGKTVIVALWASWCPPCLEEMPVLNAFYKKYHAKGVELIALSLDRPHDREAMEKVAVKVDYPVAMAADAKENGFDSGAVPVTYVIGKDGTVKAVFGEKPVTEGELEKAIGAAH